MLRNNLFKTVFASMLVVFSLGFNSCSSDDNGEPGTPPPPGDEKNIIGKWEVKNSGADYGSFEFTGDKKYIVTQHVSGNTPRAIKTRADNYIIIIFGDYSATNIDGDTYTLDLKEFGIITITIENGNATITVNGETYDTSKSSTITTNKSKTELLCHTWKESHYINEDGEREDNDDPGYRLVFTESGTFYFQETDSDEPSGFYTGYGVWEWVNDNIIRIKDDNDTPANLQITKLTEKELVTIEKGDDYETTIYFYR